MKPTVSVLTVLLMSVVPFSSEAQGAERPTFSLSPGDVTEVMMETSAAPRMKVLLTPDKSEELSTFTGNNVNQQVRFVVAGKLRSEPFIRQRIPGPALELYVGSKEEALGTVKALLTSKLKFEQLHTWTDPEGWTHYSEKPPAAAAEKPRPARPPQTDARTRALLQQLQGSWEVVQATMNGKESRDPSLLSSKWRFQGNELIFQSTEKGTARFAIQIEETAGAKAFHLTAIEPAAATTGWMLFERAGMNLRIAFNDNLEGRPVGFESRGPDSKHALVVVTLAPKK